jgi:hypothetical protein
MCDNPVSPTAVKPQTPLQPADLDAVLGPSAQALVRRQAQLREMAARGEPVQTVVFVCTKGYCGGLGDRLKGMVVLFHLALLSDRLFLVDWTEGVTALSAYLEPSHVNWFFTPDLHAAVCGQPLTHVRHEEMMDGIGAETAAILRGGFVKAWPSSAIVVSRVNLNLLHVVLEANVTEADAGVSAAAAEFHGYMKVLHARFRGYKALLTLLFTPTAAVVAAANRVLDKYVRQHGQVQKVGVHFRAGDVVEGWAHPQAQFHNHPNKTRCMVARIAGLAAASTHPLAVFVTADSDGIAEKIVREAAVVANVAVAFASITLLGKVHHLDRETGLRNDVDPKLRIYVDWLLLRDMDYLLLTKSGFSNTAALWACAPAEMLVAGEQGCPFTPPSDSHGCFAFTPRWGDPRKRK